MTTTASPTTARGFFVARVAQLTRLDPNVINGWVQAESGNQPSGDLSGHFNFLNLKTGNRAQGYSGVPLLGNEQGGFAMFSSVNDAATETAWWINNMGNFSGIKSAAGKPVGVQLAAIAQSPWDAGHYGGNGQNLVNAYRQVVPHSSSFWSSLEHDAGLAGKYALQYNPVTGALSPIPGLFGGSSYPGGSFDPLNWPSEAASSIAQHVMKGVLDVVILIAGIALIYMGIRRAAGDRGPNMRDLGKSIGQGIANAAPEAAAA